MTYIDKELASTLSIAIEGLSIAIEGLEESQKRIEKVAGPEFNKGQRVQEAYICAQVIYTQDEPYAVIHAEDAWFECSLLSVEEAKVVDRAVNMLVNPSKYIETKEKENESD